MKKLALFIISLPFILVLGCNGSILSKTPGSDITVSDINTMVSSDSVTITWLTDIPSEHQI